MNNKIRPIITSAPATLIQSSLIASLFTYDKKYFIFALLLIGQDLLNGKVIKPMFNQPRPGTTGGFLDDGYTPYGCSVYATGKPSTSSGMPSGHSQTVFFAATFWSLFFIGKYGLKKNLLKIILFYLLAIIVASQRKLSNCHSGAQILVGSLIGVTLGFSLYMLCFKIFGEKHFPNPLKNNK